MGDAKISPRTAPGHGAGHDAGHGAGHRAECVHCGRCLSVCPLFAATGLEETAPRAKFLLERALAHGEAGLSEAEAVRLAGLCLSCRRCAKACPEGLDAPELVAEFRRTHPGWQSALWKLWIGRASALWPMGSFLSRLLPEAVADALPGRAGQAVAKLRALHAARRVRPWLRFARPENPGNTALSGESGKAQGPCGKDAKAVLFSGCTARHLRPDWSGKAQGLLRGAGFAVAPEPDFACCGYTLGSAGCAAEQRAARERNLAAWRAAGRPLLVTFCATCRAGLAAYADADLGWEPGEADAWRAAVQPLAALLGEAAFTVMVETAPARAHYHRPCHAPSDDPDEAMLRRAAGDVLGRVSRDNCCGLGGVLQVAAPELTGRVAEQAWKFFDANSGDQVISGCSGCVLQLMSTAPGGVDVCHWLDAVADS
ncbi:protein of unknown function DUF224 cysteine-rich region domain protein [Desulfovibrio sp. X2]|uniref:(Fe-S)-binding protein n=1 Tax=Desulfovibrio sp. X2 TaxID=941449 RepID=UPI0003588DD3|nr:(Fe-S)-binding protein [Desulfovibrio sp. X2]EPR41688.1 protein of unknown function DUF224 cysteine-rich region domain protein [Desulfovibrio sp. X2]